MEKIKIKLEGGFMPTKSSEFSAAYDLYCPQDVTVSYGRQVIDLAFRMELPHGKAALVQPRSGFSSNGIEVLRSTDGKEAELFRLDADVLLGLVDEDYRGRVGVILKVNVKSKATFVIPQGTRLAQMRIVDVPDVEFDVVAELDMFHDRGGGFGHSGAR